MSATDSDRIDDLEITIAHQGRQIEELSDAVTDQWKTIEELRRQLARLEGKFAELLEPVEAPPDTQKPPHW